MFLGKSQLQSMGIVDKPRMVQSSSKQKYLRHIHRDEGLYWLSSQLITLIKTDIGCLAAAAATKFVSCERSFSVLRRLKNYHRNTMGQEHTKHLLGELAGVCEANISNNVFRYTNWTVRYYSPMYLLEIIFTLL